MLHVQQPFPASCRTASAATNLISWPGFVPLLFLPLSLSVGCWGLAGASLGVWLACAKGGGCFATPRSLEESRARPVHLTFPRPPFPPACHPTPWAPRPTPWPLRGWQATPLSPHSHPHPRTGTTRQHNHALLPTQSVGPFFAPPPLSYTRSLSSPHALQQPSPLPNTAHKAHPSTLPVTPGGGGEPRPRVLRVPSATSGPPKTSHHTLVIAVPPSFTHPPTHPRPPHRRPPATLLKHKHA